MRTELFMNVMFILLVTSVVIFLLFRFLKIRISSIRLKPDIAPDDLSTSVRILRNNLWIFLLPWGVYVLDSFLRALLFRLAGPMNLTGASRELYLIGNGEYGGTILTELKMLLLTLSAFGDRAYLGIYSYLFGFLALLVLIMYRKTGAWLDRKAGGPVWEKVGKYFAVTYGLYLLGFVVVPLMMSVVSENIDVPQTKTLVFSQYLSNPLIIVFPIMISSFFCAGVLWGYGEVFVEREVPPGEFITNASFYFRSIFWIGVLIFIIKFIFASSFVNSAEISTGIVSFPIDLRPVSRMFEIILFSAPLFVVIKKEKALEAVRGAITLFIENPGTFIVFFIASAIVLRSPSFVFDLLGKDLVMFSLTERILDFVVTSVQILFSCIIGLAFYKIVRRLLVEDMIQGATQ